MTDFLKNLFKHSSQGDLSPEQLADVFTREPEKSRLVSTHFAHTMSKLILSSNQNTTEQSHDCK